MINVMLSVNIPPEAFVKNFLIAAIILLVMLFGLHQLQKYKP
jgi:hypothetical protein